MNTSPNVPDLEPGIPGNAVSLYNQTETMDDFPVLKAFQQYIDSEQAKARKRMLMLCAFFGFIMVVVISVFVALLISMSTRNQNLNDRLVEYAMRDRDRSTGSAVVVQQPQDNSALLAMSAKLDEMRQQLAVAKQPEAAVVKQPVVVKEEPKGPSAEEKEIIRLKALLAAEKEKAQIEKEKARQAELEAYRRKHYPELYRAEEPTVRKQPKRAVIEDDDDSDIDALLKEINAKQYFADDDDDEEPVKTKHTTEESSSPAVKNNYSIPVDIKGSSSSWSIPLDD